MASAHTDVGFTPVDTNCDTAITALIALYSVANITELCQLLLAKAIYSYQLSQNRTSSESTLSTTDSSSKSTVQTSIGVSL